MNKVWIRVVFLAAVTAQILGLYGFFRTTPFHLYFDVLGYFMETGGDNSLARGLSLVDYAKVRRYWKGDDGLYRPLLFVWLAVQNSLFSYHYEMWNLVQIILYILVLWVLFEVLLTTGPPLFAVLWILFLISTPNANGLLRNVHLGGYLWGTGLFLLGLRGLVCAIASDQKISRRTLWAWIGCVTTAGFFYEIYLIFTPWFALFIGLIREKSLKKTFGLMVPVYIYALVYILRMPPASQITYMEGIPGQSIFNPEAMGYALENTWWVIRRYSGDMTVYRGWMRLLVTAAGFFVFYWGFSRTWIRKMLPILVPLVLSLLTYCLLIGWMRGGMYREYYGFPFVVFAALISYLSIDWSRLGVSGINAKGCFPRESLDSDSLADSELVEESPSSSIQKQKKLGSEGLFPREFRSPFWARMSERERAISEPQSDPQFFWRRGAACLGMGILIAWNAVGVRHQLQNFITNEKSVHPYFKTLTQFVDQHKNEPGFSFYIENPDEGADHLHELRIGYEESKVPSLFKTTSEIMYAPYFQKDNPRYVLRREKESWIVTRKELKL